VARPGARAHTNRYRHFRTVAYSHAHRHSDCNGDCDSHCERHANRNQHTKSNNYPDRNAHSYACPILDG
jgi:hypothetical protein